MSQFVETPTKAFPAAAALGLYLRVTLTSGQAALAGAGTAGIGTIDTPSFAAGEPCTVRLWSAQGTRKMVAAGAIASGAPVYAAAGGKVSSTGALCVGRALEVAGADNDIIEVLAINADLGAARVLRQRVALAGVNTGTVLLPAMPGLRYRLHDASLISIGGAAAGATSVDVLGTQSAAVVKLMDGRVAGLTQNTLLRAGTATNGLILAGGASFVANDANTAITLGATGTLTTSTHIDVLLTYSIEA
jgi:hypothetical protein